MADIIHSPVFRHTNLECSEIVFRISYSDLVIIWVGASDTGYSFKYLTYSMPIVNQFGSWEKKDR